MSVRAKGNNKPDTASETSWKSSLRHRKQKDRRNPTHVSPGDQKIELNFVHAISYQNTYVSSNQNPGDSQGRKNFQPAIMFPYLGEHRSPKHTSYPPNNIIRKAVLPYENTNLLVLPIVPMTLAGNFTETDFRRCTTLRSMTNQNILSIIASNEDLDAAVSMKQQLMNSYIESQNSEFESPEYDDLPDISLQVLSLRKFSMIKHIRNTYRAQELLPEDLERILCDKMDWSIKVIPYSLSCGSRYAACSSTLKIASKVADFNDFGSLAALCVEAEFLKTSEITTLGNN